MPAGDVTNENERDGQVYGRQRFGGIGYGMGIGPTVKGLLIANGAVYLLQMLGAGAGGIGPIDPLVEYFSFVPALALGKLQIWRFITYMFLHGGFFHLFFNMFGLYMFGSRLEALWGPRNFLTYYFICGIGAALTYGLFYLGGANSMVPMIGASGAIYGILLAYGLTYPNSIILLFFVLPIKAKYAVILFGFIELTSIPGGGNIAHLAHLGGMAAGFIFLRLTTGLGRGPTPRRTGGGLNNLKAAWRRLRTKSRLRVVRPDEEKDKPGNGSDRSGTAPREIDRILDKISREGLDSLTEREKEILRRASRTR